MHTRNAHLVVIGGGNMGRAIVLGGVKAGVLKAEEVVVAEPEAARRNDLAAAGVRVADNATEAAWGLSPEGRVLLAVKPQVFPEVARALSKVGHMDGRGVVSIMAGVATSVLRKSLGEKTKIVRVMPNLSVHVGRGMSAIAANLETPPDEVAFAESLFGSIGEVVHVSESLMDAFTAVVGSGPAYVFYLAEAMLKAAEHMGFDAVTAERMVRQTIAGAGELLVQMSESASFLRSGVTSKGGTTAAATMVLDEAKVMETMVKALLAARDRGAELSKHASKA